MLVQEYQKYVAIPRATYGVTKRRQLSLLEILALVSNVISGFSGLSGASNQQLPPRQVSHSLSLLETNAIR
jgi:hypothetical protein